MSAFELHNLSAKSCSLWFQAWYIVWLLLPNMTGCYLDANDAELACSRSEPEPCKGLRCKFFAMKRFSLSMFQSLFTKEPDVSKGLANAACWWLECICFVVHWSVGSAVHCTYIVMICIQMYTLYIQNLQIVYLYLSVCLLHQRLGCPLVLVLFEDLKPQSKTQLVCPRLLLKCVCVCVCVFAHRGIVDALETKSD